MGFLTVLLWLFNYYMLREGFLALVWQVLPLLSCRPPPRPPLGLVVGRVGGGDGSWLVWVPPLIVVSGVCDFSEAPLDHLRLLRVLLDFDPCVARVVPCS